MSRTLNLVDCLLTSARNLHRLGRDHDAQEILERLLRFRAVPADAAAEAHSLLAEIHFKQDDHRKTRRHLTAALTYQPHRADYHFRLALAIEADPEARPERARGHYLRALQLDAKNAAYWLDYAFFLLTLGDRKQGLRALRRAYVLAGDDPDVVGRVAEGLRQEGLWDEARTKLVSALFAHPRDRRFRALWELHQFQMLYERQQQQRRERTAAAIAAPVLLPFEPTSSPGKYVALGGKTIRLYPPAPRREPKSAQRLPRRSPDAFLTNHSIALYSPSRSVSRKSVTNMCPGLCVMQSGGRACMTTAWGVTPQAQKTGTSPARTSTGSPKSGRARSRMPRATGSPMWIGAPWARGKRLQTCTARTAWAGVMGRIDTTSGPWKSPAGRHGTLVRYIGTLQPASTWRTGSPARSSASSNVKEQPIRKPTQSSRQSARRSVGSSTSSPAWKTR